MITHHLLRPILVTLLLSCSAEKILAQSNLVEPPSTKPIKSQKLSRLQRSVERPIQANNNLVNYGDHPGLVQVVKKPCSQISKIPHILTDGFAQFVYNSVQLPIVNTTPFQETVIHLETGEHYTNISSGDPNRWSYAVATSGSGKTEQQHVLVKPSLPQMSTNLVIATDRRLYHLQLVSSPNQPITRSLSFSYPQVCSQARGEQLSELKNPKNVSNNSEINSHHSINFDYQLSRTDLFGSAPSWWPKQVFDDGVQSYIAFPDTVSQQDIPVLFILDNGQRELVNYRFKDNHFIIDKIFEKALLISGVGKSEVSVLIRRV